MSRRSNRTRGTRPDRSTAALRAMQMKVPASNVVRGSVPSGFMAPTVEAGGPYSGTVGTQIQLAATVTAGSDQNPTLLWSVVSGPDLNSSQFSDAAIEDPIFTPSTVGSYTLRLSADPSDGSAVTDNATLTSEAIRVLTFAADTAIRLPSRTFANSAANKIEYTAMRTTSGTNLDIWGTDSGADYGRFRAADFRAFRGSTGGNMASAATAHQQDVEYVVTEDVQTPGTLIIDFDSLPGTDSVAVGTADTTDAWQIGGRVGGNGWTGTIRDFKIYNSVGTLIHHWPIDDDVGNGGEITDIVGGAHGTLTLGGGSWGDL